VECPNCGEDILEDADQCPHCHQWVIQGGQTDAQSHGFVFILIAALILVVLAYWLQ
jgi:predicted nucleic acid-binding Zn ribbon protein